LSENTQENSFCVGREALDALIGSRDGNAALLYLYILKNGGKLDPEAAQEALCITQDGVDGAFLKLVNLGLAGKASLISREDVPPDYTVEDVKSRLDSSAEFKWLVLEAQRRLGRMLSGPDLIILFGMFDYLGLPAEVISMLLTYCVEENRRRYGEGRQPTMRSIEKEAYIWVRRNILTPEQAEEHLRRLIELRSKTHLLKKVLGIKNRELSPTEEKYIASWTEMGFETEALALAYDKTVVKTGELSWAYMNSIVKNWHTKGLHTIDEINAGDGKKDSRKPASNLPNTPTQEEFDRLKRYLDKMI
jgi:DnaD/phage-associated family protein